MRHHIRCRPDNAHRYKSACRTISRPSHTWSIPPNGTTSATPPSRRPRWQRCWRHVTTQNRISLPPNLAANAPSPPTQDCNKALAFETRACTHAPTAGRSITPPPPPPKRPTHSACRIAESPKKPIINKEVSRATSPSRPPSPDPANRHESRSTIKTTVCLMRPMFS